MLGNDQVSGVDGTLEGPAPTARSRVPASTVTAVDARPTAEFIPVGALFRPMEEDSTLVDGTALESDLPASVDRDAIRRMQYVARVLDESVTIPGTNYRVGLDPVLSVLPVGGDAAGAVLSLYIVAEATRLGVSTGTLLRMLANVAVDATGGSVPVLGTLFDAAWKANKWNVKLAVEDLAESSRSESREAIDVEIE